MFSDPCRQLLRAYVTALPVVRAAFGNEDPVAILYAVDSEGAAADHPQIALIPRHEDRKRCERDTVRYDPAHGAEHLTVRHDQLRFPGKFTKGSRKLARPADMRGSAPLQDIPDRLLLGKDKPPLRGSFVDGHDKNTDVSRIQKVPNEFLIILRALY